MEARTSSQVSSISDVEVNHHSKSWPAQELYNLLLWIRAGLSDAPIQRMLQGVYKFVINESDGNRKQFYLIVFVDQDPIVIGCNHNEHLEPPQDTDADIQLDFATLVALSNGTTSVVDALKSGALNADGNVLKSINWLPSRNPPSKDSPSAVRQRRIPASSKVSRRAVIRNPKGPGNPRSCVS
ncbi:unnamed protein product [Cyprideis torosa]|uniref:Uncharacterized protein n=1 Tax=Cyprideis torosa TaxID=163714 RepID=A0A7R8W4K9_9CRUS|nr:unnamed protein product [Cyprideis torosa]CAG0884328.1 unnamed protein product [Cyprideis torosa]